MMFNELQLFQKCFDNEIKILIAIYGENNVKLEWGIIADRG